MENDKSKVPSRLLKKISDLYGIDMGKLFDDHLNIHDNHFHDTSTLNGIHINITAENLITDQKELIQEQSSQNRELIKQNTELVRQIDRLLGMLDK